MKLGYPTSRERGHKREGRWRRLGQVLIVGCLAFSGLAAASGDHVVAAGGSSLPAVAATSSSAIVYPYSCRTTFAGGAAYSGSTVQVSITDLLNPPGVRSYPGGPITAQLQVAITVSSADVTALMNTGTTDWTSSNARLVWGDVTSPATPFAWHVYPVPQFSERFPISFSTASFQLPQPRDIAPGALSWDFQANAGVNPGFESGHTQCAPVPPVQIYATLLPATGPSCAHDGSRWTCRFSKTGASQLWQVPADVTSIQVDIRGASGEGGLTDIDIDKSWPGGRGGESVATVPVRPRENLRVTVGGTDGFNGGGTGYANGGGASDVRRAPYGLPQRLVVAGGGGGGGYDVFCFTGCTDDSGGAGGGVTGGAAGGGPGTQTSGGMGQPGSDAYLPTTPGSLGSGGSGATGGGGGLYGGGGGASIQNDAKLGGGGGGSGYVPPGPGNATVAGTNSGDGSVSISYTSSTTPYTSHYTQDEARWLLIDAAALHSSDLAGAQHDAAMFMTLLAALIRASGKPLPNLGSAPGTGPIAVTSTYTAGENARLMQTAALFRSDPPTLQHSGVAILAYLLGLGGH